MNKKTKPIQQRNFNPPQTLVLQKKTTQNFPNNQKVALYFCDALKKYFSLLYGPDNIQLSESDYSIINTLETITTIQSIIFNDGSSLNIDKVCSSKVLELYENLDEGKEEFENYIMESDSNFLKILDYSLKFKKDI